MIWLSHPNKKKENTTTLLIDKIFINNKSYFKNKPQKTISTV